MTEVIYVFGIKLVASWGALEVGVIEEYRPHYFWELKDCDKL
jgi:hypothetical protein